MMGDTSQDEGGESPQLLRAVLHPTCSHCVLRAGTSIGHRTGPGTSRVAALMTGWGAHPQQGPSPAVRTHGLCSEVSLWNALFEKKEKLSLNHVLTPMCEPAENEIKAPEGSLGLCEQHGAQPRTALGASAGAAAFTERGPHGHLEAETPSGAILTPQTCVHRERKTLSVSR